MKTAQCFSSHFAAVKVCVSALRYLLMIESKPGLFFVQILNSNIIDKEKLSLRYYAVCFLWRPYRSVLYINTCPPTV